MSTSLITTGDTSMQNVQTIGLVGGLMPRVVNHLRGLVVEHALAMNQGIRVLTDDSMHLLNLHDYSKYSPGDFGPQVGKRIRRLAHRGATKILMPSMIAQACDKVFRKELPGGAKLINLVDVAVDSLREFPASTTFGVMCHVSVWRSGLFQGALERRGLRLVDASAAREVILMHTSQAVDAVYAGRLDEARHSIRVAARLLKKQGADVILLGSAALPLAWPIDELDIPLVNPLQAAARALVHVSSSVPCLEEGSSSVSL